MSGSDWCSERYRRIHTSRRGRGQADFPCFRSSRSRIAVGAYVSDRKKHNPTTTAVGAPAFAICLDSAEIAKMVAPAVAALRMANTTILRTDRAVRARSPMWSTMV